jgi:hypothetical protein
MGQTLPVEQSQRAERDGSDGPTHYECGLSTCNVRVPIRVSIRTSPTGPPAISHVSPQDIV